MDQTSIITLLCISVLVATVVLSSKLIVKRRLSHHRKAINDYAEGLGFQLSDCGSITDRVIGLDQTSGHLFFIRQSKMIRECIDLSGVQTCCIDEITRTVKSGKDTIRVVDKLQLVFVSNETKKKLSHLVFFDVLDGDYAMAGEHVFLERWVKEINDYLSRRRVC